MENELYEKQDTQHLVEKYVEDILELKSGEIFGWLPIYLSGSFIDNNTYGDLYFPSFYTSYENIIDFKYPLIFKSNGDGTAEELISGKIFFIGDDYCLYNQRIDELPFFDKSMKEIDEKSSEQAFYRVYTELKKHPLTIGKGGLYEVDDQFKVLYKITYDNKEEVKKIIELAEEKAIEMCESKYKESIDNIHDYALMENFIEDSRKSK